MTLSLTLYNPLLSGNAGLGDYTEALRKTWRRSIRRRGGYWIGTAEMGEGYSQSDRDEFFTYGLLREIREQAGGQETWRGFVAKIAYQRGGDVFTQDVTQMSNAQRGLYTRIFDNLLTNGSAESGAWTAYNGATVTQSTEWTVDQTYSCKIVVADTTVRGATIQAVVAVTAGIGYDITVKLKVVGGSWTIGAYRVDTGASLGTYSTRAEVGILTAQFSIQDTSTYTGNCELRISSESTPGTVYGDAAVFVRAAETGADTGWETDADSITVHGRKENLLLLAGMSDDAALSKVQSDLLDRAWPQPLPPDSGRTLLALSDPSQDKLTLTFAGYWATLNWRHVTIAGTLAAGVHVASLAGLQPDYILPGIIESNATLYGIDTRAPLLVGDVLKDICDAGATGGAKWSVGVMANRRLNYELVSDDLSYHVRGGRLVSVSGGEMEPWLALPGWAQWDDMPSGPGSISGHAQHDPRRVYLEEIEMMPDGTLTFSRSEAG